MRGDTWIITVIRHVGTYSEGSGWVTYFSRPGLMRLRRPGRANHIGKNLTHSQPSRVCPSAGESPPQIEESEMSLEQVEYWGLDADTSEQAVLGDKFDGTWSASQIDEWLWPIAWNSGGDHRPYEAALRRLYDAAANAMAEPDSFAVEVLAGHVAYVLVAS